MILRALAFLIAAALPAPAEPICDPAQGTGMTVVGVAANDTLNIRKGPASSYALISRIKPGEAGVTATGRVAWAKGQCTTTCSGAEGGLNDIGRSIAFACKSKGQIWYEVKRSTGAVGWASGKFLDLNGTVDDGMVILPTPTVPPKPTKPTKPTFEAQLTYACGAAGPLILSIYKGGQQAEVKISGTSYLVLRSDHLLLRYSYGAGDGARLRGGGNLVEWRWPSGNKVTCAAHK